MKTKIFTTILSFALLLPSTGIAQAVSPSPSMTSSENNVSKQDINTAFNAKASNLRLHMNNLIREHAAIGALTLTALYEGADTTRLMQLMQANGNEIAADVQTAYGTKSHDTFVQLWTGHMNEYRNYTLARKNNDTTKMNTARQHLQTIATKLGNLFAGTNSNISSATISNAMMTHVNGTLAIVDAVSKGDATKTATLTKSSYDQAGTFADILTRAMLTANPNKFH